MGIDFLQQSDALISSAALVLLLMSIATWVLIFWKGWLLRRASHDLSHSVTAFWQAPNWTDAQQRVQSLDREGVVLPLVQAVQEEAVNTLAAAASKSQQLTRCLRDALHGVLHKLQYGQVVLATVGATAPFVGLLGTVWGIYHALTALGHTTSPIGIDHLAGPVGEALIMTAAGLVVAIPAVLAYNVFGRSIARLEADLEGFAHDVRELLAR